MIDEVVINEGSESEGGPPGFVESSAEEDCPNELTDTSGEETELPKGRLRRLIRNFERPRTKRRRVPRWAIQCPARGADSLKGLSSGNCCAETFAGNSSSNALHQHEDLRPSPIEETAMKVIEQMQYAFMMCNCNDDFQPIVSVGGLEALQH